MSQQEEIVMIVVQKRARDQQSLSEMSQKPADGAPQMVSKDKLCKESLLFDSGATISSKSDVYTGFWPTSCNPTSLSKCL